MKSLIILIGAMLTLSMVINFSSAHYVSYTGGIQGKNIYMGVDKDDHEAVRKRQKENMEVKWQELYTWLIAINTIDYTYLIHPEYSQEEFTDAVHAARVALGNLLSLFHRRNAEDTTRWPPGAKPDPWAKPTPIPWEPKRTTPARVFEQGESSSRVEQEAQASEPQGTGFESSIY